MALMHWHPMRALRRRDDAFDELFRDFFRRTEEGVPMEPAAELAETDNEVIAKLQVPGVEKDQVTISVTDDTLTVRGETRKEREEKRKNFYRQEIAYGAFERVLGLPAEVDGDRATAELKHGILTVTLPKTKQPKAHQVKVAVG